MLDRQQWAVQHVVAARPQTVLEIGCGPGAALQRLAEALPEARIIGIDRSPVAVQRAAVRQGNRLDGERVSLHHVTLAGLDLPEASIDVAFGVNVNVFWTSRAERELAVLRRILRPGGVLHLVYEPPGPDPWVVSGVEESLQQGGWTWKVRRKRPLAVRDAMPGRRHLVAVSATPA
ncbi:class I SAM-dependent methyltransferase [Georgenia sp. Marseille-Q6866]